MSIKEFIYYKSKIFKELKAKELKEFKTLISNAKILPDGTIQWNVPNSKAYCNNINEIIQALNEDWEDWMTKSPECKLFSKAEKEKILKAQPPVDIWALIKEAKREIGSKS
ncbi:MAG TPA: hypothetical protein ENG48_12825 [Candidatus Atribacteria bacterium]|nr:hypothetical protein [Candidatus Atribacteria bacterium]